MSDICNKCKNIYRNPCEQLNYLDVANTCTDLRKFVDEIKADVIEELFNIHCKDVSQNECDGYGGRCYQCKYERLVQKSLKMQGLKFEEQK